MDIDKVMDNTQFVESIAVTEGVVCDTYSYQNDDTKDLGIVRVQKGYQTPKQLVLAGEKTVEIYKSGKGTLDITRKDGTVEQYTFPDDEPVVSVHIGDSMQWTANDDLVFYEVCYPPYQDSRYKNL